MSFDAIIHRHAVALDGLDSALGRLEQVARNVFGDDERNQSDAGMDECQPGAMGAAFSALDRLDARVSRAHYIAASLERLIDGEPKSVVQGLGAGLAGWPTPPRNHAEEIEAAMRSEKQLVARELVRSMREREDRFDEDHLGRLKRAGF